MQLEAKANNTVQEEQTIDILELFNLIKGKIAWIAAFAMLGAVIAYACSSFLITPLYSATAVVYVNNKKNSIYVESISTKEINTSKKLVPTYQAIVCTKTAMKRAIKEKGIPYYTPEQLLSMITTTADANTGVFYITATGANQEHVADIANAVAEVGTLEIAKYVEGATVNIIDYALIPESKSYPSNRKNAVIGFVMGMALSAGFIIVRGLLDVRLKKPEELSKVMAMPVLGIIPSTFSSNETASHNKTKRGENKI